jgi:ParB family protein of integrating conjugative element (PFGI_1 class)
MISTEISVAGTETLRVNVNDIQHYSRNPRRQLNSEYDRIKASIHAGGLDQPLVISQPPGMDTYILYGGGNTRLTILQELLQETGDDRFRRVDCIVKPWSQESNLLFAHLRENELRGNLLFIDKALAVHEAKTLLQQELGLESLSMRQLEELLRERGFSLGHAMISKMAYAVEVLWPVMPKALAAGLGRPQVERIRALDRACGAIWQQRQAGESANFSEIFNELCRRHDGAEWDLQPLRDALEHELAMEFDLHRQAARLEVEAYLFGKPLPFGVPAQARGAGPNTVVAARPSTSSERKAPSTKSAKSSPCSRNQATLTGATETHQKLPKLSRLRHELWLCAAELAAVHGLYDRVVELPQQGLGFLVVELPPAELADSLDQDMLDLVAAIWWQLAASCELTVVPVKVIQQRLDPASPLQQALLARSPQRLLSAVWSSNPGLLNAQLWRLLPHPEWQKLLRLMETYRSIKRLAVEAGIDLWVTDRG